jgi:hypothetical protein
MGFLTVKTFSLKTSNNQRLITVRHYLIFHRMGQGRQGRLEVHLLSPLGEDL